MTDTRPGDTSLPGAKEPPGAARDGSPGAKEPPGAARDRSPGAKEPRGAAGDRSPSNIGEPGGVSDDGGWEDIASLEEEFMCGICYELLISPTTLNCGHSFCRACLAKAILASHKTLCPACNQVWSGHPQINIAIRSACEKLHGDKLIERKQEIERDPENARAIARFDESMKRLTRRTGRSPADHQQMVQVHHNGQAVDQVAVEDCLKWCKVCLIVTGVAVVAVLILAVILYWTAQTGGPVTDSPIAKWSVHDVQEWLATVGAFAVDICGPKFLSQHIDGHLLMTLNEKDLIEQFNMTDPIHLRHFIDHLNIVRTLGPKVPNNLGSYQEMFPLTVLLFAMWLPNWPRLSLGAMALLKYNQMFLPLVHYAVIGVDLTTTNLYSTKLGNPSAIEWLEITFSMIFLPYVTLANFARLLLTTNTVIAVVLLAYFACRTLDEYSVLLRLIRGQQLMRINLNDIKNEVIQNSKDVGLMLMPTAIVVVLWPFIPAFFAKATFYYFGEIVPVTHVCKSMWTHCRDTYHWVLGLVRRNHQQ